MDQTKKLKDHILWCYEESLKDDDLLKEENREYEYLNLPPGQFLLEIIFTLILNNK